MAVRISAAIVALILAVLLGWTIVASFAADRIIVPTGGVVGGAADETPAGPTAEQTLRERAQLQRWRAITGPSPGTRRSR